MDYALDKKTTEGHRIAQMVEERIAALQRQNEQSLDAMQTAEVRGRISELRTLLREPAPKMTSPNYGSLKRLDIIELVDARGDR
jgi:hypothetical protein